jgi:annexin A7/11
LNHSNAERVKLREEYQKKTGRDLLKDIEKNTSSDFRNVLLAVYKDPVEYDADTLNAAMKGVGSDKDAITEIICFRDFDRLNKVKQKFKEKYGKELVPEIKSETSGDYQKAILILLDKERSKNSSPDLENCKKIAEELYKNGEGKLGTNEEVFINYFTSLSGEELALVGKEYHKNYKRNLVECIESEFNGNEKDLLIAILYSLISPSEYFARKIYKCVDGAGTSDDKLIRCIVSRSDVDMKMIKRYFKQIYKNKDMIERVKEDASGDYSKLLEGLMQTK